ncbi:unnamed protein product [Rhizophagus irregularis]|nr:unnamed protein product [Rhizophagus irregularis]
MHFEHFVASFRVIKSKIFGKDKHIKLKDIYAGAKHSFDEETIINKPLSLEQAIYRESTKSSAYSTINSVTCKKGGNPIKLHLEDASACINGPGDSYIPIFFTNSLKIESNQYILLNSEKLSQKMYDDEHEKATDEGDVFCTRHLWIFRSIDFLYIVLSKNIRICFHIHAPLLVAWESSSPPGDSTRRADFLNGGWRKELMSGRVLMGKIVNFRLDPNLCQPDSGISQFFHKTVLMRWNNLELFTKYIYGEKPNTTPQKNQVQCYGKNFQTARINDRKNQKSDVYVETKTDNQKDEESQDHIHDD